MWFEKSRNDQDHRYAPLDPAREGQPQRRPRATTFLPWIYILAAICTVSVVAVISFFAGTSFTRLPKQGRPSREYSLLFHFLIYVNSGRHSAHRPKGLAARYPLHGPA